ncbi:MAG: hypothetical protein ACJAXK_002391 [Yoonia sp.]|jgi:hypothetical protein
MGGMIDVFKDVQRDDILLKNRIGGAGLCKIMTAKVAKPVNPR